MKRTVLFDVTPRVLVYRWHQRFYSEHAENVPPHVASHEKIATLKFMGMTQAT